MHELSFAEEILHTVENEAHKHNACKVSRLLLRIGQYSGLEPSSLSFCLEAISVGTMSEGMQIDMIETSPHWLCPNCGEIPDGGNELSFCPTCASTVLYDPATDLRIQEIELDDDNGET